MWKEECFYHGLWQTKEVVYAESNKIKIIKPSNLRCLRKKKKPTSKCENYLCQHQTPAKFYYKIALQKVDPHA